MVNVYSTRSHPADNAPRQQCHGRKRPSLDQSLKMLDEYELPYLLADDGPDAGHPISVRVAKTIRQCGTAIIAFTPDKELRDPKDEPVWRPSESIVQ